MRRLALFVLALNSLIALASVGCKGDDDDNGGGSAGTAGSGGTSSGPPEVIACPSQVAQIVQVVAGDGGGFTFKPDVTLFPSEVVKFENTTSVQHSATSGTGSPDGQWNVELAPAGSSGSSGCVKFNASGSYPYFCKYHAGMQKDVFVQ